MCGIVGIVATDGSYRAIAERMTEAIRHRGPDECAYYSDARVFLGHARLSIIDIEGGRQPMANETGTLQIVYNGEIYNHVELRRELEMRGHKFRTRCDTESIIHAYEEFGKDCVHQFRGMFAFGIWDAEKRSLFLARDRLGKKPLLYAWDGRNFVFASEMRSLVASGLVDRQIDSKALHQFLMFGYAVAPSTIYKAARKLSPGCHLTFRDDRISVERYWDVHFVPDTCRSEEETVEALRALLKEAVKLRLMSDVPLGALLSGGLDSSAVVALMNAAGATPIRTFSVGFTEQSYNELPYADVVAKSFATKHTRILLKADASSLVERVGAHLDEPFADVSAIPTFLVSEIAAKSVKVVLTGEGGDEIFGGYDWVVANRMWRHFCKAPEWLRRAVARAFAALPPTNSCKGTINIAKRFTEADFLPSNGEHLRWMTFFRPEELLDVCLDAGLRDLATRDPFETPQRFREAAGAGEYSDVDLYVDLMMWLPNDILFKVDLMSMAHSLEARTPLLDHKLVEFCATIPAAMKISLFARKRFLRMAMKDMLPMEILARRDKMGFIVPMKTWLRAQLKPMMLDLLSPGRVSRRGLFAPRAVQRLVGEHMSGRKDHWHKLWALMAFEMWQASAAEGGVN